MNAPPGDNFQLAPITNHYDSDDHHMAESIVGGNESEAGTAIYDLKTDETEPGAATSWTSWCTAVETLGERFQFKHDHPLDEE